MPSVALVSILCRDRVGLVSAVADFLFTSGVNLRDLISGFGTGDTLDFQAARYAVGDYITYAPNNSGTGGTVLIDTLLGARAASFAVIGSYTASDFALSNDGHGGILVSSGGIPTV